MSFNFICVLIIYFCFCSYGCASTITSMDMNNLRNGQVILKPIEKNSVKGSATAILINAPREKVWYVLERKENLTKFIDQIRETHVLRDNGRNQLVRTSVKFCRVLPSFDYVLVFDIEKCLLQKPAGPLKNYSEHLSLFLMDRALYLTVRFMLIPDFISLHLLTEA